MMPRVRWTGPPGDSSAGPGWQGPSLVLSTLFLNFFFWFAPADHFFSGSPEVFAISLGAVAISIPLLFFLGPALATHRARRSLFQIIEASFGIVPALGFRVWCAALCVIWIVGITGTILAFFMSMLQESLSVVESATLASVLILFLFTTGLQGMRTSARMALFTSKLGAAMLIAAALRVRWYLPGAWHELGGAPWSTERFWSLIAQPLMFIGPMALLAADYGCRSRTRRDVTLIGTFGLAVPICTTLFAVSLIQRAAYHWRTDLGGLANVAVALWGGDSSHFQWQWICLALVTLFGYGRFAVSTWRIAVAPVSAHERLKTTALVLSCLAAVVLSVGESPRSNHFLEVSARVAACTAAILTADYFVKRRPAQRVSVADWFALAALAGGLAAGGWFSAGAPGDYEWNLATSIFKCYGASFALCILGRLIQYLHTA
jgi:hypothetical protein